MKKILLIEDDQIFANVYRNKLVLDGFQVEIAYDGEVGLELLRIFRPDAVIIDLILPRLPGVEVIRKIRLEPEFQQLPVIVFSNTYLTSMVQEAWKAGATKCLAKANCTPNQVVATLLGVLRPPEGNGAAQPIRAEHGSAPEPAAPRDADAEFQAELRKTLIDTWPATLAAIRSQLQSLVKAESEDARVQHLFELYRRVHTLTGSAGITGLSQVAQFADALEALLKELQEKPGNINASTLRTVASAIDFLGDLFDQTKAARETSSVKVLVVDDEEISRRAVNYALEKARLKAVSVEDPLKALELVLINKFDLVFLDVGLPNMNGFELCTKLRTLPSYRKTPVVFITSLNDFESRANSTMSGGNDFIAKPFLFVELAVKALIYALRGRLQTAKH